MDCDDAAVLYRAEHARLEAQLYRRVGCRATALDLVHDVFVRLIERVTERPENPQAFLARSARNAALDHLRAEIRQRQALERLLPEQLSPAPVAALDSLLAREALQRVDRAIADLPELTRHIFLLNRVHGRTFVEISRVFQLSERGVARHMARALQLCEAALEGE